jgi:hypothetical protein
MQVLMQLAKLGIASKEWVAFESFQYSWAAVQTFAEILKFSCF